MISWLVLTATLPTSPSGLRVRVWRALKATGCAPLREGVYVLPAFAPTAAAFWAVEQAVREGGAEAHMLEVTARDAAQEAHLRGLFDRSEPYAEFAQALKATRKDMLGSTATRSSSATRSSTATRSNTAIAAGSEARLRKALRRLEQQLQALLASDFFPGAAAQAARAGLATLQQALERRLSPGEPTPTDARGEVPRLDRADYQGRCWATRRRPWVDRLATAWLIQRFVDASPRFVWLPAAGRCPRAALGFDFDGARFTHWGSRVTVEVVAAAFGLAADPALTRLGQLVHAIDVGGIVVDEAAGVELLVRGLQAQHPDDDALLAAALPLFDTLYAAFGAEAGGAP